MKYFLCLSLCSLMVMSGCKVEEKGSYSGIAISDIDIGGNGINEPIINDLYTYENEIPFKAHAFSQYDEEYFSNLRTKYKLNEMVAEAKTDFEKVVIITKWVNGLWEHDGVNEPEKNDPLYILDQVTENNQRYRCVEYGTVIHGCLLALGIPSRTLGLMTEDVETRESGAGHVVAEVYLNDLEKWVFVDGQWGIIPIYNNTPLNGVELAAVLRNGSAYSNDFKLIGVNTEKEKSDYLNWIEEYLYYFNTGYYELKSDGSLKRFSVLLYPVQSKEPRIFQRKFNLSYSYYTNSAADFYFIP